MQLAKTGKDRYDEDAGVFDVTKFQLDYLTTPSGLLDIGIDFGKVNVASRTKDTDQMYIIAYPHFNVNGEFSMACGNPLQLLSRQDLGPRGSAVLDAVWRCQ